MAHLESFIGRVGISDDWAWIRITDIETGYFIQSCGHPDNGLIIEVATVTMPVQMVVPHRAHGYPQSDIGRGGFSFMAAQAELLDEATALQVARTWLSSHTIPAGMDLRDCWTRTPNRRVG